MIKDWHRTISATAGATCSESGGQRSGSRRRKKKQSNGSRGCETIGPAWNSYYSPGYREKCRVELMVVAGSACMSPNRSSSSNSNSWSREEVEPNSGSQNWNPNPTQIVHLAHIYGSLAWRLGRWSSIPKSINNFQVFKIWLYADCMHVRFMALYMRIVVIREWIENGETWIKLLDCLIVLFEVNMGRWCKEGAQVVYVCITAVYIHLWNCLCWN